MIQTKLGMKMRALATRQKDPNVAARLNIEAGKLDAAANALGDMLTFQSNTYRNARTAYCKANGKAWDWGQAHDLERVPLG